MKQANNNLKESEKSFFRKQVENYIYIGIPELLRYSSLMYGIYNSTKDNPNWYQVGLSGLFYAIWSSAKFGIERSHLNDVIDEQLLSIREQN